MCGFPHSPVLDPPVVFTHVHPVPSHQHSVVEISLRAEPRVIHTCPIELRGGGDGNDTKCQTERDHGPFGAKVYPGYTHI